MREWGTGGSDGLPSALSHPKPTPSSAPQPPQPPHASPPPPAVQRWVAELGYRDLVTFTSTDAAGGTVYHTNVMMAVGTDVAVVCLESVAHEGERARLAAKLAQTHTVVDITRQQVCSVWVDVWVGVIGEWGLSLSVPGGRRAACQTMFPPLHSHHRPHRPPPPTHPPTPRSQMAALCGNVLELEDGRGLPVLAMSTRAYNAFTDDQKRVLRWAREGGRGRGVAGGGVQRGWGAVGESVSWTQGERGRGLIADGGQLC